MVVFCKIYHAVIFHFLFSRFNLSFNKGFYNLDPPRKRTAPFGAKTTRADSTLKWLLPLYFSILILDPDRKFFVLFKNMYDEK